MLQRVRRHCLQQLLVQGVLQQQQQQAVVLLVLLWRSHLPTALYRPLRASRDCTW
jgi:hypothetical protein